MTVEILAPAKINLGLEIIGPRDDGFHTIATVFQTISIFDRMRISAADSDSVRITNRFEQIEANLVSRTLAVARGAGITERSWKVDFEKRIPVAGGLGGASANAAATLLGLAALERAPSRELSSLALELGSDVPFLLQGGAALARGRGELLEPLPRLAPCWLVLAAPMIELDRKTARLFSALSPGDLSDGSRVERVAARLRGVVSPAHGDLANAFERPLGELLPGIEQLQTSFRHAGAPFAALSGAGPTHYTIIQDLHEAVRIARELAADHSLPKRVMIARPTATGPLIRGEKTDDSSKAL